MFSVRGASRISKALEGFVKARAELQKGVDEVEVAINANSIAIAQLAADSDALADTGDKARRAISGLDKLLNG